MLTLVNYLHKYQGIDKSLALVGEIKATCKNLRVVTIVELEATTLIELPAVYQKLLHKVSDVVFFGGQELSSVATAQHVSNSVKIPAWLKLILVNLPTRAVKYISAPKLLRFVGLFSKNNVFFDEVKNTNILLTIHTGVDTPMGRLLSIVSRSNGGTVHGYFKSIHDQGRGMSSSDSDSLKKPYRPLYFDRILAFEPLQLDKLLKAGYCARKVIYVGNPTFYRSWVDEIARSESVSQYRVLKDDFDYTAVIFTRGSKPHNLDDSPVTDEDLVRYLKDIVKCLSVYHNRVCFLIKPHPYQRVEPLYALTSNCHHIRVVYDPPAVLSAVADIAFSTFSSAILDSVACSVPSIEYFEEKLAFRRAHPDGSIFGMYGVIQARNRPELEAAVSKISSASHSTADRRFLTSLVRERQAQNLSALAQGNRAANHATEVRK